LMRSYMWMKRRRST